MENFGFQGIRLIDFMFSWSLEDIFNENLYENQVEKIPTTFQSVQQYLGSYIYPLLEETRKELASSMEIMCWAPFAEVIYVAEARPYGTLLYDVKVEHWKNRFSDRGKEPYRTLPGDILIFSDAKLETVSDLQRLGTMWTFGSVINITEDENEDANTSTHFKVKLSKDIEDGMQKSLFVVFLINITTNKRIWEALHMLGNQNIIRKVLFADNEVEENCDICCVHYGSELDRIIDSSVSKSNLNKSQSYAVLSSLLKMKCDHKPSVQLIWGPPGTGKTKTVSVMLFLLLKMNLRTLMCAPTNVAITEVASRVLKLFTESTKAGLINDGSFCSYGDILLFGNKDRLKVGSDIEEIYLDFRADRLAECLGPLTGWKQCLTSTINLLEDCVSQYNVIVENELIKAREHPDENEVKELEYKSFLEFVRARFKSTVLPLTRCLSIFCSHLPRSFLGESTFHDMLNLIDLLESLEALLFKDNLYSEVLAKLLEHGKLVEDSFESYPDASLLLSYRMKSLSVLRNLRCSLEELDLPRAMNRASIKEFCFQRASLIFCTASTSFMLYSGKIDPLKVLVIDEAAQLKECESAIPLQLLGMEHAVLIGDECQLPATVKSNISNDAGFGRSLFERLSLLGHSKHLLNIQYRMHPSISFFPNLNFYHNQICNAQNVQRKSYEKHYLPGPMFGPYAFINVVGGREEMDDVGYGRRNMVEVAVVTKIVKDLYNVWNDSRRKLSVGVVSPYAAQVVAIQDKIGRKYEELDGFSVRVKSIDGFQGGEEDIIIISTVRSNSGGSIGFITSPQRTNVALTRARHCLWILGNERTLTKGESVWEELVNDAKNRNCFFNADEDKHLAKSIVDVKKELDQLDDLLNGASILFKNERWKVLFSDNFRKSFGKLMSPRMKKSVLNLLLKLSSGWRPKNRNVDLVCESSSQILKQFKVEGLYVVCTIDIVKESKYVQVLKVWDILPLEEMPKLVKRLGGIFSMYTDDFINHCKEKFLQGNLEIPKSWVTSSEIVRFKNLNNSEPRSDSGGNETEGRSYVENSRVNESLLLMKFYSLSSSVVTHMLSNHDDREFDLPFEVTDEEMEIILFDKSSFILGRSGTGKTTVLTKKLFQKEVHHFIVSEGYCVAGGSTGVDLDEEHEVSECIGERKETGLRQLFVTVSPKLCYAVKQHVSQLKRFARGGNLSEDTLIDKDDVDDAAQFKEIPDSFVKVPDNFYPLVITFQKFLMMLDGTLSNSYFERFSEARELCHGKFRNSVALQAFIRTKEVNYDRFCENYWPRFSTNLTKKQDSSRVFTEIISHIKGGLQAADACDGKLGREEYVQLADGRVSTLSRQKREKIYHIFQDYEKMKMERGEYDLADIVIDLHRRLKNERFEGHKMDFVYIDEVQDLTMRQISLFKYVCENVDEGFVFAGDTAQTIARGIDFRFQDIRSLFYKVFLESGNDGLSGRREKGRLSEIFNLSQNFRTHDGVLQLAQSVIDLLYRFFPNFIDVLKPETSLICGEAPLLLEPGNDENAIVTIFGNSGSIDQKIVSFGAEQVILVRDDSARKDILNYVGKHALVLTIVECKGLEFQDVLLYDFFGSSPLKNQWRVVYEFMNEQDLFDDTPRVAYPTFNEARHNLLCSELKQLYVAITRTKQRLWISENVEELSKPMFDYWTKKGLVQVRKLDDSLAQAMQVASSPEEWKTRGIKLFREQNYEMATLCFERAGDEIWEKRAKASGLKANADRMRDSNPTLASNSLRQAAEIFESIGKFESAAECYYDLGEFETAGRIYHDKCGESELKTAAECFARAKHYDTAAEVYAKGNYFSECLSVCTKAKLFDMGLQYIEYWKQHEPNGDNGILRSKDIKNIEQEFLESCAHNYNKVKDNKSMMKFVRAFHSMDLRRSFLKTIDCLDELLLLEKESGNFVEAAEIARLRGDIIQESDLRGQAGHFGEASLLILWYVFCNSLWVNKGKGWPLKQFAIKGELLSRAKAFAKNESDLFYEIVCNEVNVLSHERRNLPELKKYLEDSRKHRSLRGEILTLGKILDAHRQVNSSKYEWEDELLVDNSSYSEGMISQNRVSVTTLVTFWNSWKENIVCIFEYLDSLKTQDFKNKFGDHADFCLNYFGTRRQFSNLNTTFLLLFPDADWLRIFDDRTFRKSGNLLFAETHQFVYAAQFYWQSELLSVGIDILRTLEALHKLAIKNSSFMESKCLLHIFEVAKWLLDCKFLDHKYHDSKTLLDFVYLSTKYFANVYPFDWRKPISENFVSLRGSDLSRKLLEQVVESETSNERKLTYQQIGKVVMLWLGTGKPAELHEKILKRFEDNSPWVKFIENLKGDVDSETQSRDSDEASREVSLIFMLHKALEDTYKANWRIRSYISPNCFLYLVDRLLTMVSYFRGLCFTTRSSFVEWILCQHSNAVPDNHLLARVQSSSGKIFDFVANIIEQSLYNNRDTKDWIKLAEINLNSYYPLMVLKLFVILCLLCLNSNTYHKLLFNLLGMSEITYLLPREFFSVIQQCKKRNFINPKVISEALKRIGDPLVIVSLERNYAENYGDAIFVDMRAIRCRDDIIRVLFPRKMKAPLLTNSSSSAVQKSNGNNYFNWAIFGLLIDGLKPLPSRNDVIHVPCISNVAEMKVEVERNAKVLTAAITQCSEKSGCDGEDGSTFAEANKMLDELMLLSSAFDASDEKHADKTRRILELSKSLQMRRPKLEAFLNMSFLCNPPVDDNCKASETRSIVPKCQPKEVDDRKAEDASKSEKGKVKLSSPDIVASKSQSASSNEPDMIASGSQSASSNQHDTGGNKKGKNNKSKKTKKGKGRRGK